MFASTLPRKLILARLTALSPWTAWLLMSLGWAALLAQAESLERELATFSLGS